MLGLVLAGCGFHLRGALPIPSSLNPMYIQAPSGSPVRAALVDSLQGSQVRLAPAPKDARIVLRISNESRSSRVVAVDRNGLVLAYELHLRVAFDAVNAKGREIVPQSTLDLVRTYNNPDVQVLGKQLESDLIYEDLVRDAADRILFRLQAALTKA
ncbi:MAG: LPS assembly lipoprotein LptE [Chromatiaceae bacterium]